MFTEHVGNLQAANSLEELKRVLEQVLGDCEAALTHDGSLRINGALPLGATDGVLHVTNGYIAPNDADTEPDANGELPNGWGLVLGGGAWFQGQVRFDKVPVGDGIDALVALPAGSVILWAGAIGSIPSGWAVMDGTANASGSGIDMRGMVPYGYSGAGDFATIGGSIATALTATISGNGGTTSLTINNATTGIAIANHSIPHTHTVNHSDVAASLANHTTSNHTHTVNFSGNDGTSGAGSADVDFTSGITTSSAGSESLSHTGNGASFATSTDGIGDVVHSITDTGHTHTGTVSNNSIAGSLSIGTPSVLRPAGKVLAYIEKLP